MEDLLGLPRDPGRRLGHGHGAVGRDVEVSVRRISPMRQAEAGEREPERCLDLLLVEDRHQVAEVADLLALIALVGTVESGPIAIARDDSPAAPLHARRPRRTCNTRTR